MSVLGWNEAVCVGSNNLGCSTRIGFLRIWSHLTYPDDQKHPSGTLGSSYGLSDDFGSDKAGVSVSFQESNTQRFLRQEVYSCNSKRSSNSTRNYRKHLKQLVMFNLIGLDLKKPRGPICEAYHVFAQ